jgi:3'-5' exonuclease
MIYQVRSEQVLFLDVETVAQYPDFASVPENRRKFWEKKAQFLKKAEEDTPDSLYERAGIYSEFGRIICISMGVLKAEEGARKLHIKSYAHAQEREILVEFEKLLIRLQAGNSPWYLCAHNGKEFDFPYIARRMVVNGIRVPGILDPRGKYARDVRHLDTMELWKFGDYKNYVSLDLLAEVFNLPSPKSDLDGSMVFGVYYRDKDLKRIVEYCENDVLTLTQIFLRMKGEDLIPAESVAHSA